MRGRSSPGGTAKSGSPGTSAASKVSLIGSSLAAAMAVAGAAGYIPGLGLLGSLGNSYIPMAPSTSLGLFIVAGLAFRSGLVRWAGRRRAVDLALLPFGLAVLLFSAAKIASAAVGWDLTPESRLFAGIGSIGRIPIGLMSPATAVLMLLSGLGALLLVLSSAREPEAAGARVQVASALGTLVILSGLTFIFGYLLGTPLMYAAETIPMAATTALAFLALGVAIIAAAGSRSYPLRFLSGGSTAARLSRVFIPLTAGIAVAQGLTWRALSEQAALNQALLLAIFLVSSGVIAVVAISFAARGIGGALDGFTDRLRRSEEMHRDILATAMDGFWLLDKDGRILQTNDAYRRLSGYEKDELIGMPISDLEVSESKDEVARHIERIIERGEDRFVTMHRKKDGSRVPIESSVQHRPGEEGRFVAFLRDISDRVRYEGELRASAEENRRLLSELQHRAKNSFNLIVGLLSFAAQSDESEEMRLVLESLEKRISSVSELYSLLYASGSTSVVRLDHYCERVAKAVLGLAPRLSLSMKMDPVLVDAGIAGPLGLILTEFITNSLKYAFPDGASGTLEIFLSSAGGGGRLELRDDGIGLPSDFDVHGGTGIILIRGLADQIGAVWSMEPLSRGTRCLVDFPLGPPETAGLETGRLGGRA